MSQNILTNQLSIQRVHVTDHAERIKILALEVELLRLYTFKQISMKEYESLMSQFDSPDGEVNITAALLLAEVRKRPKE